MTLFLVRTVLTVIMLGVYASISFVSIKGLSSFMPEAGRIIYLFSGGFEAGKLVVLIYVHRGWDYFNPLKKIYYTIVSLVLISLTLTGMYLFLSYSHSRSNADLRSSMTELSGLKREREFLQKQIRSVDSDLKGLPANFVKDRFRNKKSSGYQEKERRIAEIIKRETELKKNTVSFETASLTRNNSYENLYILVLVVAYEMLSIGLIFATSDVWQNRLKRVPKKESETAKIEIGKKDTEKQPINGQNKMAEIGQNKPKIQNGQNVEKAVIIESANFEKTAEIKKPETGQKETEKNLTKVLTQKGQYLKSFQKEYQLSPDEIADITERKKIKTVKGWLDNPDSIPVKAVTKLRNWHKEQKEQINQGI